MTDPAVGEFWALVPGRAVPFETEAEERVVLLRPKILNPRWAWLLRLLGKPNYRVKLDERGSFVWLLIDGVQNVAAIAAAVQARFGDPQQDSATRTAVFLRELQRGGFLVLSGPPGVPPGA